MATIDDVRAEIARRELDRRRREGADNARARGEAAARAEVESDDYLEEAKASDDAYDNPIRGIGDALVSPIQSGKALIDMLGSAADNPASAAMGAANAASFNLADDVRGIATAIPRLVPGGESPGDAYRRGRDAARINTAEAQADSPTGYAAGETLSSLATALMPTGSIAGASRQGLGALAGQGIKVGGGTGLVAGYGADGAPDEQGVTDTILRMLGYGAGGAALGAAGGLAPALATKIPGAVKATPGALRTLKAALGDAFEGARYGATKEGGGITPAIASAVDEGIGRVVPRRVHKSQIADAAPEGSPRAEQWIAEEAARDAKPPPPVPPTEESLVPEVDQEQLQGMLARLRGELDTPVTPVAAPRKRARRPAPAPAPPDVEAPQWAKDAPVVGSIENVAPAAPRAPVAEPPPAPAAAAPAPAPGGDLEAQARAALAAGKPAGDVARDLGVSMGFVKRVRDVPVQPPPVAFDPYPERKPPLPPDMQSKLAEVLTETEMRPTQATAMLRSSKVNATVNELAAQVQGLPPEQRGRWLQQIAKEHGADIAKRVGKKARVSTSLLGITDEVRE